MTNVPFSRIIWRGGTQSLHMNTNCTHMIIQEWYPYVNQQEMSQVSRVRLPRLPNTLLALFIIEQHYMYSPVAKRELYVYTWKWSIYGICVLIWVTETIDNNN